MNDTTMECTPESLRTFVLKRGLLKSGAHSKDEDACCILEARSLCMGLEKTDDPDALNMPDIRSLNDAPWSTDEARTEHMLRLDEALRPWATASQNQRTNFVRCVAVLTVNQVISELPYLTDDVRAKCREAKDTDAARDAASYAASDAASAASYAARDAASYAASDAASDAASYAASAASDAASAASDAASAASDAASAASYAARDAASDAASYAARDAARDAASDAASYAARDAASDAARDAARAASAASDAASAASDNVLITTVNLWIEAAKELRA